VATRTAVADFRRDLIDRVAATDAVQRLPSWRNRSPAPPDLAQQLGVQPDVLELAIRVARSGMGAPENFHLDMFIHWSVATPLFALAQSLTTTLGPLARSVLHAVMLTTREPSRRNVGRGQAGYWAPLPGCESARAALAARCRQHTVDVPKRKRNEEKYHTGVDITLGLERALQRRAVAYAGVSRHLYVMLWLADLVDGVLSDLPVTIVRCRELHGDESQYVLPVVELSPSLEAERDGDDDGFGRGAADGLGYDGEDRSAGDAGDRDGDLGAGAGSAA
jgi:hypothetical protein